jgi:hypothetical protein
MASKGRSAKQKGHDYERKIRNEMIELNFFPDCETSRNESRKKDGEKVDLCYTDPFNVQCKAQERMGLVHNILKDMPSDDNINLVFDKRNYKGEVVCMTKEDFYKILKMLGFGEEEKEKD